MKLIKYIFIGGLSASIHFTIASLYIYYINNSLLLSNIVGFFVAFVFSYSVQSIVVYKHNLQMLKAIKYFMVQFLSLLLVLFIASYLTQYNNYLKTLGIIFIIPMITFIIHNYWTFKD